MYKVNLKIDNFEIKGTLDMYVIKRAQAELEECYKSLKIHEIFKGIVEDDMHCVSAVVLQAILRGSEIKEEDFLKIYTRDRTDLELLERFSNIREFLMQLFKKCMPKSANENNEAFEDEFEEIPILHEKNDNDWDFPYMEYLWTTKLNKQNFWETTPKNFFEQIAIYRKLNNKEDEDDEVTYL